PASSHSTSSLLCQSASPPRALHSFPTRRSSDLLQLLVLLVGLTVIHLPRFSADTVDVSDKIIVITFLRMQDSIDRRFSRIDDRRSEEHTSELQSRFDLVCRLLLEKKKKSSNF